MRQSDLFLTALAPAIWGSTYYVTTQHLPDGYPITVAMLRALPAGLLLLLIVRQLPAKEWWGRVFSARCSEFLDLSGRCYSWLPIVFLAVWRRLSAQFSP